MNKVKFEIGPGPGNRVLAIGLPDEVAIAGQTMVWKNDSGWFIHHGAGTVFLAGQYRELATVSEGLVRLQEAAPGGFTATSVASDLEAVTQQWEGRAFSAGVDVVVVDRSHERNAYTAGGGEPWPMSVGARDAKPKPFHKGDGVVWLDGPQVLRQAAGSRPRVAGRLSSPALQWESGPHGAAVFECTDGLWAMGPEGVPRHLGDLAIHDAKFNQSGTRLMALSPDGVAVVGLDKLSPEVNCQGLLRPVGFRDGHPIVLDEDAGILKEIGRSAIMEGLSPCAADLAEGVLYGPGGTAWCAQSGRQLWDRFPLCGEYMAASPSGVVQVHNRIEGFTAAGEPFLSLPLPIDPEIDGEILEVHWHGDLLHFEMEDGWVVVDLEGRRVNVDPDPNTLPEQRFERDGWEWNPDTMELSHGGISFPIAVDGFTVTDDGRALAWSEDGMLLQLMPPSR